MPHPQTDEGLVRCVVIIYVMHYFIGFSHMHNMGNLSISVHYYVPHTSYFFYDLFSGYCLQLFCTDTILILYDQNRF